MTKATKVSRMDTCSECDGEGHVTHCDDYIEGVCCVHWEKPCDNCRGKGFKWVVRERVDPKWAKQWEVEHRERSG